MESRPSVSLDGALAVPWDHERRGKSKAPQQRAYSKTWRIFGPPEPARQRLGLRRCSTAFDRRETLEFLRFMESSLSLFRMHWDQEPRWGQRRAGVSPAQRMLALERENKLTVRLGKRRQAGRLPYIPMRTPLREGLWT